MEKKTIRFVARPHRSATSTVIRVSRQLKKMGWSNDWDYVITMTPIEPADSEPGDIQDV